jgi:hypothetical protein
MLSDLLDSYAGHFAEWARGGGARIDARVCALLHTGLTEAADQARRLEGTPVPPAALPLPAGVARLDDYRAAARDIGQGDGGRAA